MATAKKTRTPIRRKPANLRVDQVMRGDSMLSGEERLDLWAGWASEGLRAASDAMVKLQAAIAIVTLDDGDQIDDAELLHSIEKGLRVALLELVRLERSTSSAWKLTDAYRKQGSAKRDAAHGGAS